MIGLARLGKEEEATDAVFRLALHVRHLRGVTGVRLSDAEMLLVADDVLERLENIALPGSPWSQHLRAIRTGAAFDSEPNPRMVLVRMAEKMIHSKAPGFDAKRWVTDWLGKPQPALSGKRPIEMIDDANDFDVVVRALRAAVSG